MSDFANIAVVHLSAVGIDISDDSWLGNAVNVYTFTKNGPVKSDVETYPVFTNGKIVAWITKDRNDSITCNTRYIDEFQRFLESYPDEKISICYTGDEVFVYSDSGLRYCLGKSFYAYEENINNTNDSLSIAYQRIEPLIRLEKNEFNSVVEYSADAADTSSGIVLKDLIIVRSGDDYGNLLHVGCPTCDQIGLCWAASIATIYNYYARNNGLDFTPYTIEYVHSIAGHLSWSTAEKYRTACWFLKIYGGEIKNVLTYQDAISCDEHNQLGFLRIYYEYCESCASNGCDGCNDWINHDTCENCGEHKQNGHIIVSCGAFYNYTYNLHVLRFAEPQYGDFQTANFKSRSDGSYYLDTLRLDNNLTLQWKLDYWFPTELGSYVV